MPKKVAFLVGSNYVGTPNELGGCGNDVRDMSEILLKGDFSTTILTDAKNLKYSTGDLIKVAGSPTKQNILSGLTQMIKTAQAGDTLIFYYSGHGSQIPNNLDGSEVDYIVPLDAVTTGFSEDKLISSHDLHNAFIQTPSGVNILFVSDSCFSGNIAELNNKTKGLLPTQVEPFKHLRALMASHHRSQTSHGNITLIAGCKATQESTDLGSNGALTEALKEWIHAHTLPTFIKICWSYVGTTLSDLKAAITKTIKSEGIANQDPQICYEKDTGLVPEPTPSSVPAPIPAPAHPTTWDDLMVYLQQIYANERATNNKPKFHEVISWLTGKIQAHKADKASRTSLSIDQSVLIPSVKPLIQSAPKPLPPYVKVTVSVSTPENTRRLEIS